MGGAVLAAALAALSVLLPAPAPACDAPPPPPFCGKTLVLAKAVPSTVLLPGGGTFNVPTTVFFQLLDFPAGTGICPAGPYAVDIALTAICNPAPNGTGKVTGVAMTPGYNTITVPVTVPAGPPRQCTVTGTATAALADGTTLTASGDSVVCLAEPAPGDPGEPRLDLELLGAPGAEIARLHPGDQAAHRYRVTNNDPSESFDGLLEIRMVNAAGLPGMSGPVPQGTGVFSPAEPFVGDNFRLGFERDKTGSCIALTPDPGYGGVARNKRRIRLAPGASTVVDVFSRHWGMCADGSCGEGTLLLDGEFSDTSSGFACAGFVTAADSSVPPSYAWPDSGEVARVEVESLNLPKITLKGTPGATAEETVIDVEIVSLSLTNNGNPVSVPPEVFTGKFNEERGRTQIQVVNSFVVDSFFDVFFDITVKPGGSGPTFDTEILSMDLTGGPHGFEETAPSAHGLVQVQDPGTSAVDSFFDITYQISVVGIDNLGARRALAFAVREVTPRSDGTGFTVQLMGGLAASGPGSQLDAIEINQDLRGFTSVEAQSTSLIFTDGFESGDVSAWSSSVGN